MAVDRGAWCVVGEAQEESGVGRRLQQLTLPPTNDRRSHGQSTEGEGAQRSGL